MEPNGRPALLDAAMGTALRARGLPAEAFPEEWVLARPEEVRAVHAAHARAGAEVLLTCTFNAARPEARGLDRALEELCARAVRLARVAASGSGRAADPRPARVAGCVGASGLVGGDGRGPPDVELRERFARAFRALAAAGADLLWTETHVSPRESRAAVAAGRGTGRPVAATVFLAEGPDGLRALDGTPGLEWLRALWLDGARVVGVNCVLPGPELTSLVARATAVVPIPLAVKPNAGMPGSLQPPFRFAAATAAAVRAGARLAGGCCGTGPEHLRALAVHLGRA
jgi:methionine synthase I (cobalamin-dependent)